jgi:excisionase family DNA binding protein
MKEQLTSRLTIPEISARLSLGRGTVYEMLESGVLPGIRVGRRWIVTRCALDEWEKTCGMVTTNAYRES